MVLKVYNNEYFRNYDTFKTFEEVHRIKYKYKYKIEKYISNTKYIEMSNMNLMTIIIDNKLNLILFLDIPPVRLNIAVYKYIEDAIIFLYDRGFLSKVYYFKTSMQIDDSIILKLLKLLKEVHTFCIGVVVCPSVIMFNENVHIASFYINLNRININNELFKNIKKIHIQDYYNGEVIKYDKTSHYKKFTL